MKGHRERTSGRQIALIVAVQLCLLAAWELLARSGALGLSVPALSKIAQVFMQPRFAALLYKSAMATGKSALTGLLVGIVVGIVTALVAHLLTPLRPGLDRLAVTINAIPAVALGPIFILMVSRELTPALLATIPVSFLIYIAVSSGLRTASTSLGRMMTTFGAGKLKRLFYLEIPSALPSFLGGVKVSMTAAMIGAIVGEWFGAPTGLGIVILNTMQNFEIPLMWAAVLLVAGLALSGYSIAHLLERFVARRFA
ncbi:ABC transporter permease [Granulicella aggregans]|jgi:NitT/TauT family transport system permease protein|uniref:ABC transporter permease n=1 Tax=Granulicella aggregans TaxID=474949 RepID=UPI0021E0D1DF|nr:ABC transporter permease subunit [Granulicella aggregans]